MKTKLNIKRKATIDDGCNPELVRGAEFDGGLEIPFIYPPEKIKIPEGITPFSQRNKVSGKNEAIGFYEKDPEFADVLRHPDDYLMDFTRFDAVISIDCSLYRDAPLSVQVTNLYRNRALGGYIQRKGHYVVPNIRWGNELTYTTKYFPEKIAFLGVARHSIVSLGTYGCIKSREDKYYFRAGLDAMLETLEPAVVLVYGSMPESVFGSYQKQTLFVPFPDWITRMHGGDQ